MSISPSPIKLRGDFDREFKPVRGFGSAPRKLKFPTPTSAESGVAHQDRESPIHEEPSFVSQSSLYNMDGEGSWLSVESADRSYAATSERSCSFKIGGTVAPSLPPSQHSQTPHSFFCRKIPSLCPAPSWTWSVSFLVLLSLWSHRSWSIQLTRVPIIPQSISRNHFKVSDNV